MNLAEDVESVISEETAVDSGKIPIPAKTVSFSDNVIKSGHQASTSSVMVEHGSGVMQVNNDSLTQVQRDPISPVQVNPRQEVTREEHLAPSRSVELSKSVVLPSSINLALNDGCLTDLSLNWLSWQVDCVPG